MVEGTSKISNVFTGDELIDSQILPILKEEMKDADSIDMIVAFVMESGVRLILDDLKDALARGVKIRILTGNYLGITQPSALYLLKDQLGDKVEIHFYNEKDRSFHPKSYIFHYPDHSNVFVGSSNLSRSALTSGIEWNYRFSSIDHPDDYRKFMDTFEDLYENHSFEVNDKELKEYSDSWVRPYVSKDFIHFEDRGSKETKPYPRGAQIEALYALKQTRAEGATKALVSAATGIGKTYLAAFDSLNYKKVLFVAHREEILKQAMDSFHKVRGGDDFGFFNSEYKDTKHSVIFASVQTLGKPEYLNDEFFSKDYFDYIVVDEFHHAVTDQYQNIVNYFEPKFLLGLTATPERMDGRNIYAICDFNVPYEISLAEAINKGMLVPFHYYGIYDPTNYDDVERRNGKYSETSLNKAFMNNPNRDKLILDYYEQYHHDKTIGFCCSREHAEYMSGLFNRHHIKSTALYSGESGDFSQDRTTALNNLRDGKIQVLFCVDMLNEGVDVPSIDMVMFLRPTESQIVFLQQLGRGLRSCEGKQYLNVLDFIGNYTNAQKAPSLLTGKEVSIPGLSDRDDVYPIDCRVNFDLRLVNMFKEMEKRSMKIKDRILAEYKRIKESLGHVPSRMDLLNYMDMEAYDYCMDHPAENPFRNYLEFRKNAGDLSSEEEFLYNSIAREFLNLLEKTNMSRSYKMPVLMAFCNKGNIRMKLSEEELLKSWKEFFSSNNNWIDLPKVHSYEEYKKISDKAHRKNIISNPVHFLKESGKGFFQEEKGYPIALNPKLEQFIYNPAFIENMQDIVRFRTMNYYKRKYEGKDIKRN